MYIKNLIRRGKTSNVQLITNTTYLVLKSGRLVKQEKVKATQPITENQEEKVFATDFHHHGLGVTLHAMIGVKHTMNKSV